MPTKLRNLQIKRVALVDEGANPEAHIRFAKNKDGEPEPSENKEQGIIKRVIAAIAKAFGIDPDAVQKDAHTFAEGEAVRDYDKVLCDEVYPMGWAFSDSISSIMRDVEKNDTDKATMMRQSLEEYNAAFSTAIDSWSKAESAENTTKVENVEAVLTKMRDNLDALIEKGCKPEKTKKADEPDDLDDKIDEDEDDDADDGEDKNPDVKKGAIEMNFDTSKMTQEEKATFEDLSKRYGFEETHAEPEPTTQQSTTPEEDVYKGLHPAVKAELETLRKFREESEDRQQIEVAKRYELLGKKPEELAPVLKSLKAAGGSAYDDMIGILNSNLAMVEKSSAFTEIGKRGNAGGSDDAWAKIESAAQEIIKSKPELRWNEAVDSACNAHPELVEQYEKSRH